MVWWLLLCVSMTGLRDIQIAGKTLFLGVSVSVFLEQISIYISRLSKDGPCQSRWASFNPLRVQVEQNGRGRANLLSLLELECPSFPAYRHWSSRFSGLQTLGLTPVSSQFSDLQTASYTVIFPYSQTFGLTLYYTTGFHGSPACRWQILGLLSLYNHVSQSA